MEGRSRGGVVDSPGGGGGGFGEKSENGWENLSLESHVGWSGGFWWLISFTGRVRDTEKLF